jgi:hypothetical protein
MLSYDTQRRVFVRLASPDGLRWKEVGEVALPIAVGDRNSMMLDAAAGCWRIYCKQGGGRRTVHMASSTDFAHWDYHGEQLVPDDADPPETQFYGLVGFREQGVDLGFLEVFDVLERRLYAELVTLADDGRPNRVFQGHRFLDTGPYGSWDYTWAFPGNGPPIRFGEELRIYYQGRRTLHWTTPAHGGRGHIAAIGLATMRPHGWAWLATDGRLPGAVRTQPFRLTGHHLCVNTDAAGGELRVAVCDEAGRPLAGYGSGDCHPITRDVTYSKLAWRRGSDLGELIGQRISLHFLLERCRLFSFWSSDGEF